MDSSISDKKEKYETAIYEIFAAETFQFKIDQYCVNLADILTERKVKYAAYITAYNPYGKLTDAVTNSKNQQELMKTLKTRNLFFLREKVTIKTVIGKLS